MINLSDFNVWSLVTIICILFIGMMIAHLLKKNIKFLRKSLIPASVLGGLIILVFTTIWKLITKENFFDLDMFSIILKSTEDIKILVNNEAVESAASIQGSSILEAITYHALGIGFIATGLRKGKKQKDKKRATDIFNSGVTTVATYLLQAGFGIAITMVAAKFVDGMIEAAGIILCMGFGQGTGQAYNFGNIYSKIDPSVAQPLANGVPFGLSIAALGFLSAAVGGVIYLNYLKRKGRLSINTNLTEEQMKEIKEQNTLEIKENGSIDKLTVQIAIVAIAYIISYGFMKGISSFFQEGSNMIQTIYGFNFLFGTLVAVLIKGMFALLRKLGITKRDYINDFLMNRIAGVAFDIMIVAGIAVIDITLIKDYWLVLLILGIVGAVITFVYIKFVSKVLFKEYENEQFCAMYGMLTGTASTGMILLREIDPYYQTPASSNLAYQSLPAIVFGFPLLLYIAPNAPMLDTWLVLGVIVGFFVVLNIILFRSKIFRRKAKK